MSKTEAVKNNSNTDVINRHARMGRRKIPGFVYTLGSFIVFFILWELVTRLFNIPSYVLPLFSDVIKTLLNQWSLLLPHTATTLTNVLLGYLISIVVAIPIAIGVTYSDFLNKTLYSPMVAIQAIPKIALAPIFIIWFGFGMLMKVVLSFLTAFFPIVINTVVGFNSTEREMIYLARSLGASELQIFLKFRLPKALPSIFGGLKVAITLAIIGVIVGEFISSNEGLGYILIRAGGELNNELVFASIIVLSVVSIASFYLVSFMERLMLPWNDNKEEQK